MLFEVFLFLAGTAVGFVFCCFLTAGAQKKRECERRLAKRLHKDYL